MKSKLRILLVSMMVICGMAIPASVSAQKGEKTLGVSGGFSTYNNGGFADVYFQYSFANHIRLAPDIGYVFRNEGCSAFFFDVDVHFPFRLARGFSIYPLVGFTYNNWDYQHGVHASRAGANFGGGFDIYLTSNLKLTLQGKYSAMNDTGGGFFNMGIGYNF